MENIWVIINRAIYCLLFFKNALIVNGGFTGGLEVKTPPAMQETWDTRVLSLGWEAPLEKSMAAHSSILAQRIPWMEEPGGLQSIGYSS